MSESPPSSGRRRGRKRKPTMDRILDGPNALNAANAGVDTTVRDTAEQSRQRYEAKRAKSQYKKLKQQTENVMRNPERAAAEVQPPAGGPQDVMAKLQGQSAPGVANFSAALGGPSYPWQTSPGSYGITDEVKNRVVQSWAGASPRAGSGAARMRRAGEPASSVPAAPSMVPSTQTVGEVLAWFAGQPRARVEQVQRQLFKAGMFGSAKQQDVLWGFADQDTLRALAGVLVMSANKNDAHQGRPWEDLLAEIADSRAAVGVGGAQGPRSVTETSVAYTSPDDASQALRGAIQDLLGRAPSEAELSAFQSRLRTVEEANPRTSTSTTTYNPDGSPESSSSVTEGGVDAAEQAKQYALSTSSGRQESYQYSLGSYARVFEQLLGR